MKRWLLVVSLFLSPFLAIAQQQLDSNVQLPTADTAQVDSNIIQLSADKVLKKEVALRAYWLHYKGDDSTMALPNYNDSAWQHVRIGKYTKTYKDHFPEKIEQYKGISWFRLHINADSTLENLPLTLRIEPRGAVEIYINGRLAKKLGRIYDEERTFYYDGDNNTCIFNFDSIGNNVIAIRYADFKDDIIEKYKEEQIHAFELFVGEANFTTHNSNMLRNIRDVFLSLFAGIFGMLAAMQLLFWIYRREDKSNLYAAILFIAISLMVYVMKTYASSSIPNLDRTECYMLSLVIIAFLALNSFLHSIFGHLSKRLKISIGIAVVTIILIFAQIPYRLFVGTLVATFYMVDAGILMIRAMKQKIKGSRVLGIPVILLFIAVSIGYPLVLFLDNSSLVFNDSDGITALQVVLLILMALILLVGAVAFFGIPIAITTFLAKRFANVSSELSAKLVEVQTLSEKTIAQEQEKKRILENQKEKLEVEVTERTKEIVEEKKKSDDLLLNILPAEVAEELKEKGSSKAKHFDHVTVIFTDFVDFTKTGARLSPQELVNELDTCFKAFDEICAKYHIEKIKTIGDAYMAVCGLPTAIEDHAVNIVNAAIEIKEFVANRLKANPDTSFRIRIGVHSGPVVAGIVGIKKFAYDIWGDTVNTAARMESNSEPDRINISEHTYELVKDHFNCTPRGNISVKGKGELQMYFVEKTI